MIDAGDNGVDERLRRIESLTDVALSELDPDALLSELLDRVCQLLHADVAAIMLLDPHAQQLVATVAKGLEDEVRQGFRLQVGHGFAGRIAQQRQPLALEHVRPEQLASPILRARGLQSLLGVPMLVGGDLIGVLHVGSFVARHFTDDDTKLLQLAADRAGMASQAQAGRTDRMAALALQRSLLPTRLPPLPGVDLAARYVPGHNTGVGGDWYDVFNLPSGWLGVVVGDVSGHGLQAAVVMGRIRSALRAYALECDDPADALTRLDHKIHHFETGNLATALYAMISPDRTRMTVSLAGHMPPMLAEHGRKADFVTLPVDLPLGTGSEPHRRTATVDIPEGATIALYTDGLVERRGEHIDVGLERLRTAIAGTSAEQVCSTIMAQVAPTQPTDDIAVLIIMRTPTVER